MKTKNLKTKWHYGKNKIINLNKNQNTIRIL